MREHHLLAGLFVALLGLGAYRTLGQDAGADTILEEGRSLQTLAAARPPEEPGTFPETWIHGADCEGDPRTQVHAYNENLFILRQSKCETFEAPFLYLLFGAEMVLLLDTGANPQTPVYDEVISIITGWLEKNGKDSIELIVAHSHQHGDHVAGDAQFVGKPLVSEIVAHDHESVIRFWGFLDFPNDQASINLGDRVIDVLGTPGHHPNSVTLYDRRTQLLLTGDLVYPGHLFVFAPADFPVFRSSLRRLVEFAAKNPVAWVVGCHVEMGDAPRSSFRYTTVYQPGEHALQLSPDVLLEVYSAAVDMGDQAECRIFEEFVIHPVYEGGILWNG